ncbi:MAG: insulinase family protein [Oscillospiraceae bacterium]|nr:insulinase family protein [Oscillospiraceae bacterium]
MYETITLPNGVRILTEQVPGVRSACLGIWVGSGSRHERPEENGAAHFLEHMVFKGTQRRTAAELAQEMDAIGGQVNAGTTKECTCFYARALDTHLPQATDLLCDMFFHAKFREEDVQTERGVILEEIGMYEDHPEDLCAERLSAAVFAGSSLARPILGTRESLEPMTGAWLQDYQRTHYLAGDLVVALAGRFTPADVDTLKSAFAPLAGGALPPPAPAAYIPAFTVKEKPIEQTHLTLAFPGLPYGSPKRFTLQLLSTILGGGVSSRLWQRVREDQGLCYSIYSYGAGYAETGLFGIYTALSQETESQALSTICGAVQDFTVHGVTSQELDRAREQSKANVLMGLESTQSHMSNLGRGALLQGEVLDPDQIIAAYDAVTCEDVRTLAEELFDFRRISLSAVGQVGTEASYRELLQQCMA